MALFEAAPGSDPGWAFALRTGQGREMVGQGLFEGHAGFLRRLKECTGAVGPDTARLIAQTEHPTVHPTVRAAGRVLG